MKKLLLSKLRCVDCSHTQFNSVIDASDGDNIFEGTLDCGYCGRIYTISKGIVVLLPKTIMDGRKEFDGRKNGKHFHGNSTELKLNEIDYYNVEISPSADEEQDVFYGTGWSLRRCQRHSDMYNYYLNSIRSDIEPVISGKTLMNVGCGCGQESEFFSRICKADVIGLDIAQGAIEAAVKRSKNFNYSFLFDGVVGDMENLPFQDNSIDVCITHTSLHHATNAFKVIDEMARVSKDSFIISSESIDSLSIKVALLLGFTETHEEHESGNEVFRITKKEFKERLNKMGFSDLLIKTHWLNGSMKVRWGKIWGRSIRPVTSYLESEFLLRLQNKVLGRIGNSIFIKVNL